ASSGPSARFKRRRLVALGDDFFGRVHDGLDGHRSAVLAFALICCFHEGEQFDGFLRGDGRLAGAEELADLDDERSITAVTSGSANPLVAENGGAVAGPTLADAAERTDSAVVPATDNHI